MSLIRWDPFGSTDDLMRSLPSLIGRSFGASGAATGWTPSADISETDKEFLIRAELPAVRKEDVKVTLDNGTLTIEGERRHRREDKNEKFHRVETFQGSFLRRFELPESAQADAVTCDSKDGVLTVHIPKKAATKSTFKQIPIG